LLPANLIACDVRGGVAHPRFLDEGDRPWIRRLVEAWDHQAGRPVRELEERLREPVAGCADDQQRLVAHLLLGLARSRVGAPLPPRQARATVFAAAARSPGLPAEVVLADCAAGLRLGAEALGAALFADLPGERLALPPGTLDPGDLALRANLLLAQSLLARAVRVEVEVEGNARAVVRHASLRGLICAVAPAAPGQGHGHGQGVRLQVSGPFALFRRTLLYGRALGSLLPVLAWTRRFRLEAHCELRGRVVVVTLASGDPIFPSAEPRRFDSLVEERFARDFGRAAPGWEIVREPEPLQAGGHLVFPDFAVHPRAEPGRRWLVEIVGFWTPEYLATKLERLRQASVANLVLCIDEGRNVGQGDLPEAARVVRYRRRVDARRVLELIEAAARSGGDDAAPRRQLAEDRPCRG
jgi:predicted nuclease of restriction endonuclease-like RecB superfamily